MNKILLIIFSLIFLINIIILIALEVTTETIVITTVCAVLITICIYYFYRIKYIKFTNEVINQIENLIQEKFDDKNINNETLDSKISSKLYKLQDITQNKLLQTNREKAEIEEMISDITHQIKTPISNIRMYSDTILNSDLDKEKEKEFLEIISNQVDKMEFLTDTLSKMSKLETNLITLNKQSSKLIECIEIAIKQELSLAQNKNIEIEVTGDKTIILHYDKKWTLEAICNILENAIKYTNNNGKIIINIEKLEIYTRINIIDNGIGINPENINNIFKRFYREAKVHNIEGVGIGLYLAKKIIELQSGYIKVKSELEKGSTFSIFFPN